MRPLLDSSLTLLIPTLVLVHLYYAPYTKVEESFNIQAVHDIITYGVPTKQIDQRFAAEYDHVEFPGSVPRTFVGALVLAGVSRPFVGLLSTPAQVQFLVRAILGLFNSFALLGFRGAIAKYYGPTAGNWYIILQAAQFHVIYYASRSLPNMFAFGLTTLAHRYLLLAGAGTSGSTTKFKERRLALYLLTFTGVVFRSEVAILLATQTLYLLARGKLSITSEILPAGIAGGLVGLLLTVPIDSFFWLKFPLWPEWTAFYYNTIQGHASDWGVSPWYEYFVNAGPKLLLNPLSGAALIPLAAILPSTRSRSLDILIPLVAFEAILSILPHKEWRFIIYIIPGLTGVAAAGAAWIWNRRMKSAVYALLALVLVGSVAASFIASFGFLYLSSLNYPGGEAITRLHKIAHGSQSIISVHMDNLSCQTGVTRFLEMPPPTTFLGDAKGKTLWMYDKTEDPDTLLKPQFWQRFDYALAEKPEKAIGKWEILETIDGFAGLKVERLDEAAVEKLVDRVGSSLVRPLLRYLTRGYWLQVKMEPKINILRKQPV